MSDQGSFPPPGSDPGQPPPGGPYPPQQPYPGQPYPQPYAGQPYPAQPYPQPGMLGAAHKPGAIALRPLGLGDVFDGAFRIIRFNPRATVGAALLVAAVATALPVVVTSVVAPGVAVSGDPAAAPLDVAGGVTTLASLLAGSLLLQVGILLVTGLVAHVTHEAAVGRRIGLAQAWALTRGSRWRLVGLVVLLGLGFAVGLGVWVGTVAGLAASGAGVGTVVAWAVLSGLVALVLSVLVWVRVVLLATPALVLERVGVGAAIARAWRLSRGQFWRLLGIALLAGIVAGVAGYVLGLPFTLLAQLGAFLAPERAVLLLVVGQALATVLSTAFTAPFTAATSTLQYLDQRMRKEAYDVELMARAGITGG